MNSQIMEQEKEVRVIQVDYKCPKCETGYMRPDNGYTMGDDTFWNHKCNNYECNHGKKFTNVHYPYIKYEEIAHE